MVHIKQWTPIIAVAVMMGVAGIRADEYSYGQVLQTAETNPGMTNKPFLPGNSP